MNIANILSPDRTYCGLHASSQKKALEEIASKLSDSIPKIKNRELFSQLVNREKIGSTAIGNGIAIPHCRLGNCQEILGGLFTLKQPIDFQALDQQPVNILFVLLVPLAEVDEHLHILATLAEKFASKNYKELLLKASTNQELFHWAVDHIPPPLRQVQH